MRRHQITKHAAAESGGTRAEKLFGRGINKADLSVAINDDDRIPERRQDDRRFGLAIGERAPSYAGRADPTPGRRDHTACRARIGS